MEVSSMLFDVSVNLALLLISTLFCINYTMISLNNRSEFPSAIPNSFLMIMTITTDSSQSMNVFSASPPCGTCLMWLAVGTLVLSWPLLLPPMLLPAWHYYRRLHHDHPYQWEMSRNAGVSLLQGLASAAETIMVVSYVIFTAGESEYNELWHKYIPCLALQLQPRPPTWRTAGISLQKRSSQCWTNNKLTK